MTAERHARVSRLLREHGPLAPPELRERIEAGLRADSQRADRRSPWRGPIAVRVALAGAAAVPLIALVLLWPTLLGGDPTVNDAHGLSAGGPAKPAPPSQAAGSELLAADVEGVAFPDWKREFGWEAIGRRTDELDGRSTETVFYEHEGHTIGYTIVPGDSLDPPAGAERRVVDGVELQISSDDHGHDIVVFERDGKTCVLSGHVEHRSTLVELAGWRGDGRIQF